ncbi:uncharacterized protein AKAW2_50016A [Aspergillus luchuensis]|uniref:Uncharacterized protein n=1 Tax=Aspergillus kawachii TaxID=1069201 RepID=A0A7R7WBA4_ASPKA|nr:uncharacterized protein AKAW2_50016A [Aspergillus luchuensis]BCR99674.1 hypothetical protein AKAW2_50016A [Aspergillus luchuensis]
MHDTSQHRISTRPQLVSLQNLQTPSSVNNQQLASNLLAFDIYPFAINMLQNNRTAALLELVRLKKSVRTCGLRTHFLETRRRIGPKSNRCPLRSPDEVPPKYYYERKEALQTCLWGIIVGPRNDRMHQ